MSRLLPLFPLQLVVFPDEKLNLHIFEPRYKQLINECESDNITFGIPAYIDDEVMKVGTEMELVSIEKKYPNGEMDVRTRGVGIFRMDEYMQVTPGKLYAGAHVEDIENDMAGDFLLSERVLEKVGTLFDLLNINKDVPENDDNFKIYDIAHHIGLNLSQEYNLLRIYQEKLRLRFVYDHLEKLIPIVSEMENLRKRVQMNGHFKNIKPPKV
ncbi:MAG: LON peptidase substrate-binding domain-containing protein [Bacteroidota bacterium]